MTVEQPGISCSVASATSQSNEIWVEAEIRFADRVKSRATFRITPVGLISTGLMVAAIILSAAVRVRAAR
jgi:hypothetical protein